MPNWVYAFFPFALFSFLAVLFTRRRFSAKVTCALWAVVIAAVSVTHIVFFAIDRGATLLLSLMPITAYLPVVIAFFILSKRNVVSNTLAVLLSSLCAVSLVLADAAAGKIWARQMESAANWGTVFTLLHFAVLIVGGAALGCAAFIFLRKIFRRGNVLENRAWYVLPAIFLLLMLSLYERASTTSPLLIAFLLILDVCVLGLVTAFIVLRFRNGDMAAERAEIERQLAAERERYGALKSSLESDRRYRHDVKHHFTAIAALAANGNNADIAEYVSSLGANLAERERGRVYCDNGVVNAVLSAFAERAERAGIDAGIEAVVPDVPPVDEYDLCALIGNALDNAFNACGKIADGARKIAVSVDCDDYGKTVVKVTNTVAEKVALGKDGLPIYERTEEHGWGLSSMAHIAEKYGGLMRCASEEDGFTLVAVLFRQPASSPERKRKGTKLYSFAAVPLALCAAVLSVNCMPAAIDALETLPAVGRAVEIIDFRNWGLEWGDSKIDVKEPIANDPDANVIIAGYVKECREMFDYYFARKYHGYAYAEFTSTELIDDEEIYVLRMSCLIQAGSSAEYLRYFTVDKRSGEIVALPSLFREGSDWNAAVSGEIRRQMAAAVAADEGDYFGYGIWADREEGFTRLDDPNFYIDALHRLVIVFDKYEVAPGSMGSPRFVIPRAVVADMLAENSILREDA